MAFIGPAGRTAKPDEQNAVYECGLETGITNGFL